MNRSKPNSIHDSIRKHSLSELITAVGQGQDVDALDSGGRTALFYACKNGDIDLVGELLNNGANVNAKDRDMKTPLHFAASSFQVGCADFLIKRGADVAAQDVNGNTPLSDAVYNSRGRGDMIKLLLSSGASKTLKNNYGVSPEDLAKSIGNYNVAVFFVG